MSEVVTLALAVVFVVIGFVRAASVIREVGEAPDEHEAGTMPGDAPG